MPFVYRSTMPTKVTVDKVTISELDQLNDAKLRGQERWHRQVNNEKLTLARTSQLSGRNQDRKQGSKTTAARKRLQHVADGRCSRK